MVLDSLYDLQTKNTHQLLCMDANQAIINIVCLNHWLSLRLLGLLDASEMSFGLGFLLMAEFEVDVLKHITLWAYSTDFLPTTVIFLIDLLQVDDRGSLN